MRQAPPGGYWLAAYPLGVDPARCLVFEDTFAGHEAARQAGMPSIACLALPHDHGGALSTLRTYDGVEVSIGDGPILLVPPETGRRP